MEKLSLKREENTFYYLSNYLIWSGAIDKNDFIFKIFNEYGRYFLKIK